jgi:hypothetical protein
MIRRLVNEDKKNTIRKESTFRSGDKVTTTDPFEGEVIDYVGRKGFSHMYIIRLKDGSTIERSTDDMMLIESKKNTIRKESNNMAEFTIGCNRSTNATLKIQMGMHDRPDNVVVSRELDLNDKTYERLFYYCKRVIKDL